MAACLLISAGTAEASSLSVSPTSIDVLAPQQAAALALRNGGDKPLNAQVRVFRWRQPGGEDVLEPAKAVVASPAIIEIKPGADYTIRIVRTSREPVKGEENYRVVVDELPDGFRVTAATPSCPVAAMADEVRDFYGVQFHPEVTHTRQGGALLQRFIHDICQTQALWTPANIIEDSVRRVREQVGSDQVLLGLSGGVDSSVVAALLHKAIGDQLTCVFVDHGLLRKNEGDQVMAMFAQNMGVKVIRVNAAERYFAALKGVDEPEFDDPDPVRGWAAQYLNVWPLLIGANADGLFPNWPNLSRPPSMASPDALGISANATQSWLSLAAASSSGDRTHVGAVMRTRSVERGEFVSKVHRIQGTYGCDVLIDPKGRASSLIDDLEDAGVTLKQVTQDEFILANADFWTAYEAAQLEHPNNPALNDAIENAGWREIAKRRVFAAARGDIDMLEAGALAVRGSRRDYDVLDSVL